MFYGQQTSNFANMKIFDSKNIVLYIPKNESHTTKHYKNIKARKNAGN